MRQAEKKKEKDKIAVMLVLCFCVIALTSVFTIKASIDKISDNAADVPAATETPTEDTGKEREPEETNGSAAETSGKIPTVDSRKQPQKNTAFIPPVDLTAVKISKGYIMDTVVYNKTLDQYMTHPGIDFEGPSGSGVKAAADGTITNIYTDDAYGITIEITHKNGCITRYSNLATDRMAEKGDTVKKGQVISSIGKSALYESLDKPHLHFEAEKNGKAIDPATLIDLQTKK